MSNLGGSGLTPFQTSDLDKIRNKFHRVAKRVNGKGDTTITVKIMGIPQTFDLYVMFESYVIPQMTSTPDDPTRAGDILEILES